MPGSAIQTFHGLVEYFTLAGLILDGVGAILLLGPDLPFVAKTVTNWERYQLKRLVDRLRRKETITSNHRLFEDLRIAVGQGHVEGATDYPFRENSPESLEFFWQFDEIEGFDDYVEIRTADGGNSARFRYENLETWVESFTRTDRAYLEVGGFLLAVGFFAQFIHELSTFNSELSLVLFLIGGVIISYIGLIHRPGRH